MDRYLRAVVLRPLTESLVVRWLPTVEYHLHRLDILANLKSQGLLTEFQVEPDWLGVRSQHTQATIERDHVSLYPRGSILGADTLAILGAVLACASPSKYRLTVPFQFLSPIAERTYDEARVSALEKMSFGDVGASDFALMLDGHIADAEWHCEFGIVSEEEVEPRLRRLVGRSEHSPVPTFVPVPAEVPPVSFFADFIWHVAEVETPPNDDRVDAIAARVGTLAEDASAIISKLYQHLCEQPIPSVSRGSES